MFNTDKYHIIFFSTDTEIKGGDAILIRLFELPKGGIEKEHLILIDAGYTNNGKKIVNYIKTNCSTDTIDMVFNTHPDQDHIAGIIPILESDLKVGIIYMNRPWKDAGLTTEFFKDKRITDNSLIARIKNAFSYADKVEELANKRTITVTGLFSEETDKTGIVEILSPSEELYQIKMLQSKKTPDTIFEEYNKPYVKATLEDEKYDSGKIIEWFYDEETSEVNETSLVIAFNFGSLHFLFTGDAGKDALINALEKYKSLHGDNSIKQFTHVQLPHHGSRKNITPEIIKQFDNPKYIISCPKDGECEGHPSNRLINKVLEINPRAKIYRTGKSNFNFHKGMDLKFALQNPASMNPMMDGKKKIE